MCPLKMYLNIDQIIKLKIQFQQNKQLSIFKTSEENNLVILKKLTSVKYIRTSISLWNVMNENKLCFTIHETVSEKSGQMEM